MYLQKYSIVDTAFSRVPIISAPSFEMCAILHQLSVAQFEKVTIRKNTLCMTNMNPELI